MRRLVVLFAALACACAAATGPLAAVGLAGATTATINGTVTSSADGSAVVGACVTAVSTADATQTAAVTGADGSYSVDLPPGTYQVRFDDCSGTDATFRTQWYAAATDQSAATDVTLAAIGDTWTGIDAVLVPTAATAPDPPTGVSGAGGVQEVSLTWSAPANDGGSQITGYDIARSTVSGAETSVGSVGTATHFTDTLLSDGTTYFYTVTAVNAVGAGIASTEASVTTASAPDAPTGLNATGGMHQVALSWTAPAGNGSAVTSYDVYRATGNGTLSQLTTGVSGTTYTDQAVLDGTSYTYAVSAVNGVGEGAQSGTASATTYGVPDAPVLSSLVPGVKQVALAWTVPADNGSAVVSYDVYRATGGGSLSQIATGVANPAYTDTGLADGTSYTYAVSAVNGVGQGAESSTLSATTAALPDAPVISSAVGGVKQVVLAWTVPAGNGSTVQSYDVYRATGGGLPSPVATGVTDTTYTDTGLTDGTTYSYAVSAVNGVGESVQSTASTATTAAVPGAPSGLSATGGVRKVALSWSAASANGSAIQSYTIYRSTTSGAEVQLMSGVVGTSYIDSTAVDATTYFYTVRAVNGVGLGAASTEAPATTFAKPGAPQSVAAVRGNAQVALTWSAPADGGSPITGYTVYRSTTSGQPGIAVATPSTTSYTDLSLTNGTTYYYVVTATTDVGEGAGSTEVSAVPATNPGAPQSVGATGSVRQVSLSWTAPPSGGAAIDHYDVYRSTTSGVLGTLAGSPTSAAFTDSGLTDATTYYYVVVAVNAVGPSAQSAEAAATTFSLPGTLTNLTPTRGNQRVDLSWTAPANGGAAIDHYNVYRSTTSGVQGALTGSAVTTAYADTQSLTNGTTYYYEVTAVTAVGEGATSTQVSAVPATTPGAPSVVTTTRFDQQVSLTWTAPSSTGGLPVTSYDVYRSTTPGSPGTKVITGLTTTAFLDTGRTNAVTYYYEVSAENQVGEGTPSAQVTVVPATVPGAPTMGTVVPASRQATLSWAPPASDGGSQVTGYDVYRSDTSGGLVQKIGFDVSSLTYTDTGLTNGATYYYTVRAHNFVGDGPASAEKSAQPADVPGAPQNVAVVRGNRQVSMTWSAPGGDGGSAVLSYSVYRSAVFGVLGTRVGSGLLATSFTDTGLTNGTTYYYAVTAVNGTGEGTYVAQVPATPATTPDAPGTPTTSHNDQTVSLSWAAPGSNGGAAISGYNVYRSTTPGAQGTRVAAGVTSPSYTDGGLTNGTTYYYEVTATNAVGESAATTQVSDRPLGAGPVVAITGTPPTFDASRTASLTFSATNPSQTTLTFTCTLDGGAATSCSSPASFGSLSDGTHTFSVRVADAYGVSSSTSATWVVDTTAPATKLTKPTAATTMGSTVSVAWQGSDASGVQTYDVRYTRATWNGRPGAPVAGLTNTTATTATLTGIAAGSEYCFQVRAKDWAGNVSGWSASTCTALPLDDRSLTASAGWKKLTGRSYYTSTAMQATSTGRTLTRTGAVAGRAVLVIDQGKGFGSVDILYNGKRVKTVSLAATRTRTQVAVTLPKVTKANTTIVIRTRSTAKVLIDGLLLARV